MPAINVIVHNIFITLRFLSPEYLKIRISLFLKNFIKKNCVESKNIKGNISKINEGELRRDKYKGKYALTFISLKKSNSLSRFNIIIKPSIIKKRFKKDLKKIKIINFTYVFIL
jgi:hypothetical protein